MIFFAGGLLLTPGVLTDVFGLLLLIPLTRAVFKKWIFWGIKRHFRVVDLSAQFGATVFRSRADQGPPFDDLEAEEDIIEGEIVSRSTSHESPVTGEKRIEDSRDSQ